MPRTLIAGGTGFIGQRLALLLHQMGHDVLVIGTNPRPCLNLEALGIAIYFGDLAQSPLDQIISDSAFDYAVNLSGYIDHRPISDGGWDVFETHTKSAVNIINALDKDTLRTFVQVGTSDEYGNIKAPQHERHRESCVAPYSLAKLSNTHLVQMLARNQSFPGVVVRPFLVYGPGQSENRLIPFIIQQCLDNKTFDTTPAEQFRDFLYIDDFCKGVISLFDQSDHYGSVFNVASGKGITVRHVIETVIAEAGGGAANFGGKPYRPGESMALFADISAIKKATGWHPETSLKDGLRFTIDAIKNGN